MPSKYASLISFLLVLSAHVLALAGVLLTTTTPPKVEIVQPTIQGVLVMAEPEEVPPPPEPPPPPPPEPKPEPKPVPKPKPLPKAPPSERAVKAPEPEPPPPPTAPAEAKPAPPAPAPVLPPRADAGQLSNPAPVYPSLSRRLREEGIVVLEILIKADGSVGEVRLKNSSGYKRLDETAMKAVAKWRYHPATQGGKSIDFWYEQPVEFSLH
ncbi:energy transducer TonB [Cellvibrio japonicus]|uniref:Protein TonB n=1 Tax=Cellvibrio japonicus (strain Ueda107) TaxID=498211 RepID=B3PCI4_CELJU|nr:energy transducer TonB [Cellvibrio japonicus]ACE83258.1 Uvs044 [Cellvibrio japonicus Ueda107]QEI11887.1 energy transducer TonB [Cellvibrio japonicus]QEI15461.1 energy transducer TonB [Cellvibrio japonicus]QEI19040.1 energy transducer TonB [Cellvibrio japonicus]